MMVTTIEAAKPAPKPAAVAAAPLAPHGNIFIAKMKEQADLSAFSTLPRGADRRAAVYDALVDHASKSQADALGKLGEMQKAGLVSSFESMYLPNAIIVKAAPDKVGAVADALKGVASIAQVTENKQWSIPTRTAAEGAAQLDRKAGREPQPRDERGRFISRAQAAGVEWSVEKIGAPAAWAKGFDGSGITVGVVDTGLDASHPAIKGHYRGTKADGTQTHDYNWYDPFKNSPTPYDDGAHGTHCAGTVAGGDGTNLIGVAPGAKIIASKAIQGSGYNTSEGTMKALQFMLAPTDTAGKNPDPRKGADIVSNSWGNATPADLYVDTWNGLLAAGIEVITAAGNEGPGSRTVHAPGSYPQGITVAASTSRDTIAGFSSRGPSQVDPKAMVPDLAAPGARIRSSVPGGGYATWDGTSMATPAVAGAVALMLQAKPTATHEEIYSALTSTATDIDAKGPDHNAGFGRINVDKAIEALLKPAGGKPPKGTPKG